MPRISLHSVCLAALLAVAVATAHADVIASNITGPTTAAAPNDVCGGGNEFCLSSSGEFSAEAFTPLADYTMTDAQVLVNAELTFGDPNFNVFLYSNASGQPGSLIEQIGFGLSATTAFPGSIMTANSIATPITLTSGTEYWLVLGPADSNTFISWGAGGSSSLSEAFTENNGADWSTFSNNDQFQIDGTPVAASVPEPSSLSLFTAMTLLLILGGAKQSAKHTARTGS